MLPKTISCSVDGKNGDAVKYLNYITVNGIFTKGCASSLMHIFTVSALPDNQIS